MLIKMRDRVFLSTFIFIESFDSFQSVPIDTSEMGSDFSKSDLIEQDRAEEGSSGLD